MKRIKLLYTVTILLLFSNCKMTSEALYEKRFKEAYIYGFKIAYFQKLLQKGFNNSSEINAVLNADKSKGMADMPPSVEEYRIIDSLCVIGNIEMREDSVRRIKAFEGAQGKYIFSYALQKYNSKWLDSIAKARYKIYKKLSVAD